MKLVAFLIGCFAWGCAQAQIAVVNINLNNPAKPAVYTLSGGVENTVMVVDTSAGNKNCTHCNILIYNSFPSLTNHEKIDGKNVFYIKPDFDVTTLAVVIVDTSTGYRQQVVLKVQPVKTWLQLYPKFKANSKGSVQPAKYDSVAVEYETGNYIVNPGYRIFSVTFAIQDAKGKKTKYQRVMANGIFTAGDYKAMATANVGDRLTFFDCRAVDKYGTVWAMPGFYTTLR